MTVPTYNLTCRDAYTAGRFLTSARTALGYLRADTAGPVITIHWGGPFDRLTEIGDLARYLDAATDEAVADFYIQYAAHRERGAAR